MKYLDRRVILSFLVACLLIGGTYSLKGFEYASTLALLAGLAFIQNMAFTLVSRSRQSADPDFHRKCAWGSNGIWFLCFAFLMKSIWKDLLAGDLLPLLLVASVYTLATAEGSVLMMKYSLRTEKGKRRVGARKGNE